MFLLKTCDIQYFLRGYRLITCHSCAFSEGYTFGNPSWKCQALPLLYVEAEKGYCYLSHAIYLSFDCDI